MKYLYWPFAILLSTITAQAQVPTWSDDIATIIYNNCAVCHHAGSLAPFSLMSYEEVQLYGFSIQTVVNAHTMPPWPPDPDYNHLAGEKVLSDEEINTINEWVNNYMPPGELSTAPSPPAFSGNIMMDQPDDTIHLPVYQIPSDEEDYMTFVIHSGYTETKYLNQLEFLAGDPSLVHHAIYYQDTSDVSWLTDLSFPGPGFPTYSEDMSPYVANFGGYVPGQGLLKFPSYMGIEILPGTDFVIEIHYGPGNEGKTDSSKLYLKFSSDPNVRPIFEERYLFAGPPSLINGPLFIPANTVATFNEQTTLPFKKSLLGLAPHSHRICTSWKVFAVPPGEDTTQLLYIPKWDFGWQYTYLLTKVIGILPGTTLFGEAVFDNTINNSDNPNNPPLDVEAGQSTLSEMMACRFWVMDYQEGDENIILDSAFYGFPTAASFVEPNSMVKVLPNPADRWIRFSVGAARSEVNWVIKNALEEQILSGAEKGIAEVFSKEINISQLPSGIYFLCIRMNEKSYNSKIIISH